MRYNEEYEYANTRLSGSIVMLGNKPIVVTNVDGFGTVMSEELGTGEPVVCPLGDINVDPVPLGYLNKGSKCFYLARIPRRKDWRQGLRTRTLAVLNADVLTISHKNLAKCISGKYPTLTRCIKALGRVDSIAFSRKFALNSRKELLYKEIVVGALLESGKFKLYTEYQYLYELLDKHSGGNL